MSNELVDSMVARYKQWQVGGVAPRQQLVAKQNYNLFNLKTKNFLQYESQTWGVNIGWTPDGKPATAAKVIQWSFVRCSEAAGPILYGEPLAIKNSRESFIRYTHRDVGVNIGWNKDPLCEWKLLGGAKGTPVLAGDTVAIYNEKDAECLIYFDRTAGGDIGWPSSKTWGAQVTDKAWSAGKAAALRQIGL